jgi:hypothetical protein
MNAVVHVKRNAKLYAVGEVVVMIRFCDYLKENYIGHKITVNPDASGNARSTSGASDFSILKANGFDVVAPKKNPAVNEGERC